MAKKPANPTWKNRIVGTAEVSPDELLANPYNWRIHPQAQQDALEGVLREVGWVQDVLVNQRTGYVVDGHLRVLLALRHSEPTVPVKYVDLDEAEERLILATLDPLAAVAETDKAKLVELLHEVSIGEAAVQQLLADWAKRARLNLDAVVETAGAADAEDLLMPDAELPPPADVHQVLLFFDTPGFETFTAQVKALRAVWQTESQTDTVAEALTYAVTHLVAAAA